MECRDEPLLALFYFFSGVVVLTLFFVYVVSSQFCSRDVLFPFSVRKKKLLSMHLRHLRENVAFRGRQGTKLMRNETYARFLSTTRC